MPTNTTYGILPAIGAGPAAIADDGGAGNTEGTPAALGNTPAMIDITHVYLTANVVENYTVSLYAAAAVIWRGGPIRMLGAAGMMGTVVTLPEPIRVAGAVAMTATVTSVAGAAGAGAVQIRIGFKTV